MDINQRQHPSHISRYALNHFVYTFWYENKCLGLFFTSSKFVGLCFGIVILSNGNDFERAKHLSPF